MNSTGADASVDTGAIRERVRFIDRYGAYRGQPEGTTYYEVVTLVDEDVPALCDALEAAQERERELLDYVERADKRAYSIVKKYGIQFTDNHWLRQPLAEARGLGLPRQRGASMKAIQRGEA